MAEGTQAKVVEPRQGDCGRQPAGGKGRMPEDPEKRIYDAAGLSEWERAALPLFDVRFFDPELAPEAMGVPRTCLLCGTHIEGHEVWLPLAGERALCLARCPFCEVTYMPFSGCGREWPKGPRLAGFLNSLRGMARQARSGGSPAKLAAFLADIDCAIPDCDLPITPAERDGIVAAALSASEVDRGLNAYYMREPFGNRWEWIETANPAEEQDRVFDPLKELSASQVEPLARLGVRFYSEELIPCPACGRHHAPLTHVPAPGENRSIRLWRCRCCGMAYSYSSEGLPYPEQPPLPAFLVRVQGLAAAAREEAEEYADSPEEPLLGFLPYVNEQIEDCELPVSMAARRAIAEVATDTGLLTLRDVYV